MQIEKGTQMSQQMAATLAFYHYLVTLILPPAIFAVVLGGFWLVRVALRRFARFPS
jgi:hypothetical protein